ncbi:MAG: succinate dehydrogenase, hydrophobic membrane anchor protein [Pseudomonadota bacterium]
MAFLTDRKRALGLGSGHQGTDHHWHMMASSMALLFAIPAFVITFGIGLGKPHDEVLAYYGQPLPAIVLGLSLIVIINHVMQEALVAVEDYVHGVPQKLTLMAVKGASFTLIAVALFAVARMAL